MESQTVGKTPQELLRNLRGLTGMNQENFAGWVGWSPNVQRRLEEGTTPITAQHVKELYSAQLWNVEFIEGIWKLDKEAWIQEFARAVENQYLRGAVVSENGKNTVVLDLRRMLGELPDRIVLCIAAAVLLFGFALAYVVVSSTMDRETNVRVTTPAVPSPVKPPVKLPVIMKGVLAGRQ